MFDAGGATDDFVNAAADAELDGTEGNGKPSGGACYAGAREGGAAWSDILLLALFLAALLAVPRHARD